MSLFGFGVKGTVDLHSEVHSTKHVGDNGASVAIAYAGNGITFCPKHPSVIITRRGIFNRTIVDKCLYCEEE